MHPADEQVDYRSLIEAAEGSGMIFFALRVRPDVELEYLSGATEEQFGITTSAACINPAVLHSLLDETDRRALSEALSLEPGQQTTLTLTWRLRSGRAPVTRCSLRARQRPDGSVLLEGIATDITDVRQRLESEEERLRSLAANSCDVAWIQSADGSTLTYLCDSIERTRGITRDQALRQTIADMHPPESAARLVDYVRQVSEAVQSGQPPPEFHGEQQYYRADGSLMYGELTIIPHLDSDGRIVEYLGIVRDVSRRRMYEAELTRLASTDDLTGVFNRRRGTELLAAAFNVHQRHERPLTLLMLDVDHLKMVNDTAGHQGGDVVLTGTAGCITETVGNDNVVARWGGDEFVVLLSDCELLDAVGVADRIRLRVAGSQFDTVGRVTVSIGAAELAPGEDLHAWLVRTDRALYEAKRSGRNTVWA
jgi:diguanylate cyclase (GGDEF)-like protein/PAS domain S-box-containing protein